MVTGISSPFMFVMNFSPDSSVVYSMDVVSEGAAVVSSFSQLLFFPQEINTTEIISIKSATAIIFFIHIFLLCGLY